MATREVAHRVAPPVEKPGLTEARFRPFQCFIAFFATLSAALGYFYWPWLTNRQAYYQSDLTYYFQPFTAFIVNAYRHGKLPLWNPYLYTGMPQIAVPSPSPFYPPILLFVGLPFSQALSLYLVLHQMVAGVGAFLLVGSLGWGFFAASICGLGFALCGYMFAFTSNYTLVATIVWLPLLMYLLRSIDDKWTASNVMRILAGALCMFMMVAAGRPEISVPAALVAGGYVVISALHIHLKDRLTRSAITIGAYRLWALVSGGLLAAPILLPAMEWVKLSPRQHGLNLQWVLLWSTNWYDCLGMFFAQPLGDLTVLGSKYLNLAASRANALPFLDSAYIGPIILTLAIWGFLDRTWRWRWWALALFAGTMIMALGNFTPVAPFICKLSPIFSSFRYPVKLMIFPIMALCIAAARGCHLTSGQQIANRHQLITAGLWAAVALVGMIFLAFPPLWQITKLFPWNHGVHIDAAVMRQAQEMFGYSLCLGALLGGLTCGSYLAYRRGDIGYPVFVGFINVMLVVSLVTPSLFYLHHGSPQDFYSRPSRLAADMKREIGETADQPSTTYGATAGERFNSRVQPLYFDPLTPGTTFLKDQHIGFQTGFFLNARQLMLQNSNVDFQVPYAFGYEAAEVGSYKELFSNALGKSSQNRAHSNDEYEGDAPMARFCQMTSVSTVMTQSFRHSLSEKVEPLDKTYFTLVNDDPQLNVKVYKTNNSFPRAYFASKVGWSTRWPDFFRWILDADNTALFDKTYVEVAQEPNNDSAAQQRRENGSSTTPVSALSSRSNQANEALAALLPQKVTHYDSTGSIRFVHDLDDRVAVRTSAPGKRLLVLTDHYYPGWICRLDGKETEIVRVNYFARGVFVPAGDHTIEFAYEPPILTKGFAVAGFILLSYAFWLLVALFRRRSDH